MYRFNSCTANWCIFARNRKFTTHKLTLPSIEAQKNNQLPQKITLNCVGLRQTEYSG